MPPSRLPAINSKGTPHGNSQEAMRGVRKQETKLGIETEQAVALAQAINETASAGTLDNNTPGSRGPKGVRRSRNASQLGTDTGAQTAAGQKK